MKAAIGPLATVALLVLAASSLSQVLGQQTQASYTVNLSSFTLQVTYPSEVMPGDNITVNVQATPKTSTIYLKTLTATVYYGDSAGLHSIATQTLVSNSANGYGTYGTGSFSRSFTVNVPQDAPRTSLVALFSETTQSNYYSSYYYGYGPYYGWYGCPDPILCGWYYPSYSYSTTTDAAIAPLSYIKAATPESVALQSENQMLQQQLNQTQAQNQQLQTTIAQQTATINVLGQQVASANSMAQTYEIVALIAIIVAVALAALATFMYHQRGRGKDQRMIEGQVATEKTEAETSK